MFVVDFFNYYADPPLARLIFWEYYYRLVLIKYKTNKWFKLRLWEHFLLWKWLFCSLIFLMFLCVAFLAKVWMCLSSTRGQPSFLQLLFSFWVASSRGLVSTSSRWAWNRLLSRVCDWVWVLVFVFLAGGTLVLDQIPFRLWDISW